MTAQRARQDLRSLHTKANSIILNRRKRGLRYAAEASELILAQVLEFAKDSYGLANRDFNALLRRTKLLHLGFPVVVSRDRHDLKYEIFRQHSILQTQPGGPMALPHSRK